jgi:hypothetical protein
VHGAVNRGDARRLKHTKRLEFVDIANAPLARASPGLCSGVDAW